MGTRRSANCSIDKIPQAMAAAPLAGREAGWRAGAVAVAEWVVAAADLVGINLHIAGINLHVSAGVLLEVQVPPLKRPQTRENSYFDCGQR